MAAPVLSISEQKSAISGKKKKKKTMKNVLAIPNNLKVEIQFTEEKETDKLTEILDRLLPSARLPTQLNSKSEKDSNGQVNQPQHYIRRKELSLGVNNLSRSIKKALVSAVLIAADVQPKFLIHHLNLLCSHNKVPFLHMPGLRETTKNNLGFPCIAVGFKKESDFFAEVIEEITSIWERRKAVINSDEENEVESCSEESDEEESNKTNPVEETTPFSYLTRTSKTERVFVPERNKKEERKEKTDFIHLTKEDSESSFQNIPNKLGISSNLLKKKKEMRSRILEDNNSDNEDLEVPRKKAKKDWVIDKVGERAKYHPTNYIRVPSNPNRCRKK